MIPSFNLSGVLPPFSGPSPVEKYENSPYLCSISEFVGKYSLTERRVELLFGLLDYRTSLIQNGIVDGIQWINGSFVEKVEDTRGRPPADIDVVTLAYRPFHVKEESDWKKFIRTANDIFNTMMIKSKFHCDAYFVDLDMKPDILIRDVSYWYGLFSHQRGTFLWKGLVEVPLVSDDREALGLITEARNA